MKRLVQDAAVAAEAHRKTTRLLAQGIDDTLRTNPKALQAFFVDFENYVSLVETHSFAEVSRVYLWAIQDLAVRAISNCVRDGKARKKYEDLTEEVLEHVQTTCPCRDCVKARASAKKTVSVCLQKIQKQKKVEP